MENLIKEFKKLKTPQRADLISNFIYLHTKLLKTGPTSNPDSAIKIENDIPILPLTVVINEPNHTENQASSALISNTPNHLPFQVPGSDLPIQPVILIK